MKINIDRILFYCVCVAVLIMSVVMCWNTGRITTNRNLIDAQINKLVDHRYRDIDAQADLASRDAAIAALSKRVERMEVE